MCRFSNDLELIRCCGCCGVSVAVLDSITNRPEPPLAVYPSENIDSRRETALETALISRSDHLADDAHAPCSKQLIIAWSRRVQCGFPDPGAVRAVENADRSLPACPYRNGITAPDLRRTKNERRRHNDGSQVFLSGFIVSLQQCSAARCLAIITLYGRR